jgi:RimJ/RimL family protein N-acetyltransferase/GNAT superfamily N-acetyltransferase
VVDDAAVTDDLRILRSDDPARVELEARGCTVVARSWGANLDLGDPRVVDGLRSAAKAGTASGVVLAELTAADAPAVVAVEAANHGDYPQDPATRHERVTIDSYTGLLSAGSRAWGGSLGGQLVGLALATPKGADWWDVTFASVLAAHRGTGVGQAVVAEMALALRAAGATRISTGGAASNSASRAAALALGAVLEPEWLTYAPPGAASGLPSRPLRGTWPAAQPTLTDGVVQLRPWRPEDADSVFRACQDPDIQRFTQVPVPYLLEHAVGFVADAPRQWADGTGAQFAVTDATTGQLLGCMGLLEADRGRGQIGAGYWTAPWGRSRGFTRRALRLATGWALGEGGFDTVVLEVELDNPRSMAVVRAVGYVPGDAPIDSWELKGSMRHFVGLRITRNELAAARDRSPGAAAG